MEIEDVYYQDHRQSSICTFSGVEFYSLDPRPEDVFIDDIAHALAMRCRYAGHTHRFYSIAEHSVLVMWYVRLRWPGEDDLALNALLHDASEAYLADINGPIKRDPRVAQWWTPIEERVEKCIATRFELEYPFPPEVKVGDRQVLTLEIPQLMAPTHWWKPGPPDEWASGLSIQSWDPLRAKAEFMAEFKRLFHYG